MANHYASRFTYDYLGREAAAKEEKEVKTNERKSNKHKMDRYAEIVREMYQPTVDK
jgi:hypothetical protein